jgi:hypothetical protein
VDVEWRADIQRFELWDSFCPATEKIIWPALFLIFHSLQMTTNIAHGELNDGQSHLSYEQFNCVGKNAAKKVRVKV